MTRDHLKNLAIPFTVALLCTAAGETWFRLADRRMSHVGQRLRLSGTPGRIYEYIPGAAEINSHGLRDVEHTFARQEGVFRTVIIGDSVAEGVNVPPAAAAR